MVNRKEDFLKFKPGDVLVTAMTHPEFLPLMRLASAIVTDEGGVICHAAIVARELRRPCVTGTQTATRLINDGDIVTVDASRGVVKVVKD